MHPYDPKYQVLYVVGSKTPRVGQRVAYEYYGDNHCKIARSDRDSEHARGQCVAVVRTDIDGVSLKHEGQIVSLHRSIEEGNHQLERLFTPLDRPKSAPHRIYLRQHLSDGKTVSHEQISSLIAEKLEIDKRNYMETSRYRICRLRGSGIAGQSKVAIDIFPKEPIATVLGTEKKIRPNKYAVIRCHRTDSKLVTYSGTLISVHSQRMWANDELNRIFKELMPEKYHELKKAWKAFTGRQKTVEPQQYQSTSREFNRM